MCVAIAAGGLVAAAPTAGALAQETVAADSAATTSLVEALRKTADEEAIRELYQIGGAALPTLARALEAEQDPAAWLRLADTFEGVLGARLEDLEVGIDPSIPIPLPEDEPAEDGPRPLPSEGPVADVLKQLGPQVQEAGYACGRELVRPAAANEELARLARVTLLQDLVQRLVSERERGSKGLVERLARVAPLALPVLEGVAASENEADRAFVNAVTRRVVQDAIEHLRKDGVPAVRYGEERLFGLGDLGVEAIRSARAELEGEPDVAFRLDHALVRIHWRLSQVLYERIGHQMDGFFAMSWRERRLFVFEIEKQGDRAAIPVLRRVLELDSSPGVKLMAAESLARLGDRDGLAYLTSLGQTLHLQSPEVAAGIAMAQGIKYLQIRRYDRAIKEFRRVLELQATNETAFYNLACAYSLKGDLEEALGALEQAIQNGFDDAEHMHKDPDLDPLRLDPRFHKLIQGLEDADPAAPGESEDPEEPQEEPDGPERRDQE
ncbi:MAG: TPR end-of-group domain-containing protein [Planctomycetota bacterium]